MDIVNVMNNVKQFFNEYLLPIYKIPSIKLGENGGWNVTVEVIEEKEYMIKHAKDEMLGVYIVEVNEDFEITSYSRKGLRSRSAINKEMQ